MTSLLVGRRETLRPPASDGYWSLREHPQRPLKFSLQFVSIHLHYRVERSTRGRRALYQEYNTITPARTHPKLVPRVLSLSPLEEVLYLLERGRERTL